MITTPPPPAERRTRGTGVTPRGVAPASCPMHFGFLAGACARCDAKPLDVPRAESSKGMRPATTTATSRERRLSAIADAAARATAKPAPPSVAPPRAAPDAKDVRQPVRAVATQHGAARAQLVRFRGEERTEWKWAQVLGLDLSTVKNRVRRGIPLDLPRGGSTAQRRHAGTWNFATDEATT